MHAGGTCGELRFAYSQASEALDSRTGHLVHNVGATKTPRVSCHEIQSASQAIPWWVFIIVFLDTGLTLAKKFSTTTCSH
jgi:hypothetical protein